jgi:hypothetical protein
MQVFQTAGVPPYKGKTIFPMRGCTIKRRKALTNAVSEYHSIIRRFPILSKRFLLTTYDRSIIRLIPVVIIVNFDDILTGPASAAEKAPFKERLPDKKRPCERAFVPRAGDRG